MRDHHLDGGRDWDCQQRPRHPGELRPDEDGDKDGQRRQPDGAAHDPRHEDRVLQHLQQDDEDDDEGGLLPALREGDDHRGDAPQPRPEKVAEGISTALFITLEGVALAVPAIFFFSFFRNLIAMITMEATRVADRTIASLVQAAKQAKAS